MALKAGENYKTKANKNSASSSSSTLVDRVRFPTAKTEQIFETLTKYRSIWRKRLLVLDELDLSIHRNLVSRNWGSLCNVSHPPPIVLIKEFYSNFSVYSENTCGHYLTTWIRGKEYRITKLIVSEALSIPLVHRPTFPYIESHPFDDVMSLLRGSSVT